MIKRNLLIRAHKCAYRNIGKKRKNNTDQTVHKGLPVVPFYNDANAVISHPVSVTDFVVKRLYDSQFGGILILTFYGGNICGAFKADFDAACARHEFIFAEGSGGIICPIRYDDQKIFLEDIIKTVNLPILVVTTAALGSINACVLTVEYARSRGLDIRGLIVNRYSSSGNLEMEDDNIRMMQDLTGLEILAKIKDGSTDLGVQPF